MEEVLVLLVVPAMNRNRFSRTTRLIVPLVMVVSPFPIACWSTAVRSRFMSGRTPWAWAVAVQVRAELETGAELDGATASEVPAEG